MIYAAISYFFLFMLGTFVSFLLYSFADIFSEQVSYILYYLVFFLQSLWALLYIGLSLLLSYESYTAKKLRFWDLRVHSAQKLINPGLKNFFRFP